MAQDVSFIGNITNQWALNNGYNNLPEGYMEKLAWSGLTGTDIFDDEFPEASEGRNAIEDAVEDEAFPSPNNPNTQGQICEQ